MSAPSTPSRPPTALDAAERFLGWALIFGVVLLALTIGGGVWLNGRASTPAPTPSTTTPPAANTVALVIDFGNGSQRSYPALTYKSDMSAVSVLQEAAAHNRAMPIEISGAGETAFVSSIDGIKNEGAGEKARNWQFFVNADFGRRGAGATMLKPGDRVTWMFAVWQDNPTLPAFPPVKP